MERLTEWIDDGEHRQAIPKTDIRKNGHNKCCNKLAEYEDLEEQGLLVRLPCKVGDVEVTRTSKNMMFKSPDITPQLAISAFAVLHQYCSSISPHDCIRCAFYKHCPECFMGCPGDQGEVIRKLQSNE